MGASFAVLGFRNPDGGLRFALTSQPLTYVARLRIGVYASSWVERDATLLWAVPAQSHSQALILRDRWNEIPATQAYDEVAAVSVPEAIIDELHGLGGSELIAKFQGLTTGREAARALELISDHGGVFGSEATSELPKHDSPEPLRSCPFIPMTPPEEPSTLAEVGAADLGIRLAIFDLDGTLVNSSALENVRDARDWNEVHQRIGEVRPLSCWGGCAPHQLPRLLNDHGVRVALVSRANRSYVNAVAKNFDIYFDTIDAPSGRDKAELFAEVMRRFGASPAQTVVFGDDASDYRAAARHQVLSLGNPWAFKSKAAVAPDVAWLDATLLLERGGWHGRLPYIGEADQGAADWHRGSLLTYGDDAFTLGRYFTKLRDSSRHQRHPLSRGIIVGKKDPSGDPFIREAFRTAIQHLAERIDLDAVVSVPPYDDQSDRFMAFRQIVTEETGARSVPSRQLPFGNQLGRFGVDEALDGSTVLLIDDVVTKGGTLGHLRVAAERARAGRIIQLAFGFTQL